MAIMSTVDGCDSMVITLVHVLPVSSTDIHVSICANETYQGQYFSRDTSFISAILSSLNGCDSMITTKIHVFPAYNTTQNIVLCAEEKYLGQYFASDTSWVNTWISTDGCDSMLTTLVHVLPFNATLVNAEICFGQLYGFNGNNYDLSGTYIDTLTNSAGCDSVLMLNLHVLPDIGLYAVPDEATLELGEGIGINIFNSPLANIVSYSWSPGLGVSCPDCSSALLVPLEDTRYMVVAFDASGCRDTVFIPVLVNGPVIFVPNVFTPNGDGNNDYFEFFGSKKAVNFLEVKIFDRWGDKVFESNDLDFKWDGTYKRQLLPPAVFVYTLRVAYIDGYPEKMFKGSVTLLR